jgi:uncharacterized protein (TIGR02300 family)
MPQQAGHAVAYGPVGGAQAFHRHVKGLLTELLRIAKGRTAFSNLEDFESVAKPELGTKRLCAHCGARFYDLNHAPITCPKCGTVFEAVVATRGRPEPARASVREVEPVAPETREAEFVSLEEADAEAQGKKKPAGAPVDVDEDVEIDDESLDDAAFIEENEEEDTDVTEIIGNDIENEEET